MDEKERDRILAEYDAREQEIARALLSVQRWYSATVFRDVARKYRREIQQINQRRRLLGAQKV